MVKDSDGRLFLDHDPDWFEAIIQVLRASRLCRHLSSTYARHINLICMILLAICRLKEAVSHSTCHAKGHRIKICSALTNVCLHVQP